MLVNPQASKLSSYRPRAVRDNPPLESSAPPPGFTLVDAQDGSMAPSGPSYIKRRLEAAGVQLVAIRHGQSQSNADSDTVGSPLLYGQSESPLTQKGKDQAAKCAADLYTRLGGDDYLKGCLDKPEGLPVFISSSVGRALETSKIITDYLKARLLDVGGQAAVDKLGPLLSVEPEPRLRETNFGSYEKMPLSQVEKDYPDFIHSWRPPEGLGTDFLHKFPGGESRADLAVRTGAVMDSIARRFPNRTVVMLSHSEALLGARAALGLSAVKDGKVRAETSTIANATPYWLVGQQPFPGSPSFQNIPSFQDF